MPTTMETWAKLTGGYGVLKGGISGFNKQLKKLGPEAKMERIQKKEDAKIKKEATKEFIRDHKTTKQALREGKITIQEAQEEYKKTVEAHTAKIQAIKTGPDVAGQDNKTGGPDVAGQDISGIDSVAIVSAIDKQTVEIITELGTDSPKDAGSPKLEPDAKFTPESELTEAAPGSWQSIWGSAEEASSADAGSPTMAEPPKVSEPVSTDVAVLEEVKETNVLLSPMNSALAELVDMGRDEIASDARREKREIKEEGRALEDRRDANKKGLGKKEDSPGSPTLNKEGGGFFKGILTSGKSKMLKMAAGFGKMLLPLLGYAAVAAVLAGGGILLSNWAKKNYGAEADKTFTDIEDKHPEYAAHIKKMSDGHGTLTKAAGAVAGVLQDLTGVEDALENAVGGAIELQNDWLENWTGDLTSGVLTAVRRTGELQEETQLAANQIFRNGIDDVTGQLERGELGEDGLGELQGIIQQSMATLSGGTNWIAEQFGIENLTGMWELGKEDQIKILALLKEQMLENDVELKKTVAEARNTDIRVIQQNNPALAERIAEAQGEVVAREKQKEDTTEVEEDRIKVLQERFRELAGFEEGAAGWGPQGVSVANEEKTRAALQAMLEKNEMTSEELLLLMKDKGFGGYSQEQKDLMGKMAIQKGIVKSQYGTTKTQFGMGDASRKQQYLAEQKKLELEKVEKAEKENLANKAAATGAVDLGKGNAGKWLATIADLK